MAEEIQLFWLRYPKASRYYNPEEILYWQGVYPGWTPGRDVQTVVEEIRRRNPDWDERKARLEGEARREASRRDQARRVGQ